MSIGGSKGGSKSTSQTNNTSTEALDPRLEQALYGNIDRAQQLGATPYQPFTGTALQDAQSLAQGGSRVDPISYVPSMQTPTVAGPAAQASASQGYENIDRYMNPYLDDVVGAAQSDAERARQMARLTTEGQAQAAGAFGGSRHGVADAITDSENLRNTNSLTANLRNTGWNTALGASVADADRNTGVSTFNAGARNTTEAQNAAMEAQRAATNYGALNEAARYNIGVNQAAQQGNQQAELARIGALGQIGQQQYDQYAADRGYGLDLQQTLNQALGLVPSYGTTNSSGTASGTGKNWGVSASASYGKG